MTERQIAILRERCDAWREDLHPKVVGMLDDLLEALQTYEEHRIKITDSLQELCRKLEESAARIEGSNPRKEYQEQAKMLYSVSDDISGVIGQNEDII